MEPPCVTVINIEPLCDQNVPTYPDLRLGECAERNPGNDTLVAEDL